MSASTTTTTAATPQVAEIGDRLSEASDARLLEVVSLIDRLPARGSADRLLDPVRPRLAGLRPPRPATLGRVLVLPVEGLLAPAEECWQGRRRIPRALLGPTLASVLGALDRGLAGELRAALHGRDMRSAEVVLAVGTRLWPEAAGALRAAPGLPDPRLAGAAALLTLAPSLVPVVWSLPPKPMAVLPPEGAAALAPVVAAARAAGPDALHWLFEFLLARSATVELVLKLLRGPELGLPPRERDDCVGQVVRGRLADMRQATDHLRRCAESPSAEVVDDLVRLVADLDVLEGGWVSGTVDKMLLKDVRATTSEILGRRLDQAVGRDLLAGLEVLAEPESVEDAAVDRLERTARAVRRLGVAGAQLGLAGPSRDMFLPFLEDYRSRLLGRTGPDLAPEIPLEQIRLVEILFGPDAAMAVLADARGPAAGP